MPQNPTNIHHHTCDKVHVLQKNPFLVFLPSIAAMPCHHHVVAELRPELLTPELLGTAVAVAVVASPMSNDSRRSKGG